METKYCHTTNFREATSVITGRKLRVNLDLNRVFVPEDADLARIPQAVTEMRDFCAGHSAWWGRRVSKIRICVRRFENVTAVGGLVGCLDDLFETAFECERPRGAQNKLLFCLGKLWSHGLVGMPATLWPGANCRVDQAMLGFEHFRWVERCEIASAYKDPNDRIRTRSLVLRLASPTQGIRELGDLAPNTINQDLFATFETRALATVRTIMRLQVQQYGDRFRTAPEQWGSFPELRRKNDLEFRWVLKADPGLELWREALAKWGRSRRTIMTSLVLGQSFLNYLVANPKVTRNPVEFCDRGYTPPVKFQEYNDSINKDCSRIEANNRALEFFEWFLDNRLSAPDDYGRSTRSPQHWNPVSSRLTVHARPLQTSRDALPTRYLHELITILTQTDFAWAKRFKQDYIRVVDPVSNESKKVWCPVRAGVLLLKLYLPLRLFQVRVLDSGEMDSERFQAGQWVPNLSPLVPKKGKPLAKGCLRKFQDTASGQVYTGFFINTNKTADRLKDEQDRGYELPWQHEKAIAIIASIRAWQETHNPIAAPTNWAALHDWHISISRKLEARKRLNNCFLFRDPCGTHFNEPISHNRIRALWIDLLMELEKRVAARGETLPSGAPIRFIKWKNNRPGPIYDLHTLRVSLLTALAVEGGVPLQILSKCVAGHASILMTLYYVKLNPSYVTEQLAEGQKKVCAEEQQNFLRFLEEASYSEVQGIVISNAPDGIDSLKGTQPGSWVVGDLGICPVGCSLCYKGGPQIRPEARVSDNVPAPGGARNCVRCRFLVTGPAFLGGLVAHFNANSIKLMEAAERFRASQAEIQRLEDAQLQAEQQGKPFGRLPDLNLAYERLTHCAQELDEIAHNAHATYALVERCRALLKKKTDQENGKEFSLVLAGKLTDLDVAVRATSNFELCNAVCQVAKVYPNDASPLANLKRAKIIDTMLSLNGRRPALAALSAEEALAVGNEFTNFLLARAGREDTVALMEGKKLLRDCGIAEEADRLLEHRTGTPVQLTHFVRKPATPKQLGEIDHAKT